MLRIDLLGVKLLVLVVADHISEAIIRGDVALNPLETVAALPFTLLRYGVPFVLYVVAVRTWTGTVVAGVGWIAVEVSVALAVADGSAGSGAGGLTVLPPLLLLTVAAVALVEHLAHAGRTT